MKTSGSDNCWDTFLPARRFSASVETLVESLRGKSILLTGAGGCIGSALAKALLRGRPRLVVLLDQSEQALHQLVSELAGAAPRRIVLGDVRDEAHLRSLMQDDRPDLILHAAAFKHVPLMEENPFAAVGNNAVATWQLARVAADFGVPKLLLISTDKAANARSIMGASKRLAEIAVSRWSARHQDFSAIRLGNVAGSHGSVVPLFLEQIARGGPVTVTHPEVSRFFITLDDAVQLILSAAALERSGALLLPEFGEPIRIAELAKFWIQRNGDGRNGKAGAPKIEIRFTGLRPGDKLSEDLISTGETLHPTSDPLLRRVAGPSLASAMVDATFGRLRECIQTRALASMLESVRELVPEYVPSETLLRFTPDRTRAGNSHA